MASKIGWLIAMIGQGGVFFLLFRFIRQIQRRGLWWGLIILPALLIILFGYELLLSGNEQVLAAYLAGGASILGCVLLWVLLPSAKEAFTQYNQIQSEKERYHLILDHLPFLVIYKDLELSYRKVNATFAQYIGKAVDLLIGRSDADFFPPKVAQKLEEDQKKVLASQQPLSRKIELITAKGNRWIEVTFTPLIDKLGITEGILVSGSDLTEISRELETLQTDLSLQESIENATRKMIACEDIQELTNVLLDFIEKISGTSLVALAIPSEDGQSFVVEQSRSAEVIQSGKSSRSTGTIFAKVVQSGQIEISEEISSLRGLFSGDEGEGIKWVVGIPVYLNRRVWGVITLFYHQFEKEQFDRKRVALTKGIEIAQQLLAKLNARQTLEKRLAETRNDLEQTKLGQRVDHFLSALATRLINSPPPHVDTLLEKAIGTFAEYVGAGKSYVYLFKKEEGGLQAHYRWVESGRLLPPTEILEPYDAAIAWLVEKINRQEIIALSRSSPEMGQALQVYFDAQEIDFLVCVPMVLRRTVVGYFGVEGNDVQNGVIFDQIGSIKAMADLIVNTLDRKWSAEELDEKMRLVGERISQLELRNQRSRMLAEMGDLIQSCRTADEAFPIVARYAQTLMPESVGALYLFRSLQDVAEKVAFWGKEPSGENELGLSECWGIRRGKIHIAKSSEGPLCDHLGTPIPEQYVCVPLIAQGETIGLLHIRGQESVRSDGYSIDELSKIGLSIAEHIAPALSNLNLRDKLRSQAIRDPLTGLFNRRYMEETLDREIRRAARHQYSVRLIMCDIDQMKPINDRYGHDAGDVVLRQLGGLMKKIFRGEDVACRYGGDEFMIILPEASLSDVWQRAENLREMVKKTRFEYEGKSIGPVTVSIGVAAYPDLGSTVDRLIQVSDAAAYLAKREGGDRVMIARQFDDNNNNNK